MNSAHAYGGIIDNLVAGRWVDPASGRPQTIPVKDIVIAESLEGRERQLVDKQHRGQSLVVVSDAFTREALGARVLRTLEPRGNVSEFVWPKPRCSTEGVAELMAATADAEALIAVGSGTISDSVKYGTFLNGKTYSVFPTSPMNAYTTPTASVSEAGFKRSITCHSAAGVFFDLGVLAKCPPRLVSAAFADVVCRTTSQVDWLMSHLLFGTPYNDVPYTLLAIDEDALIDSAAALLGGDLAALALLTRVAAIMGLGTSFTGTTHVGSMAEHMISHFVDMFAGAAHPGTSHGEQVGVATLTMSRLQNEMLAADAPPPPMAPTVIPEALLSARFGADTAARMVAETRKKALDRAAADRLGARFAEDWEGIANPLREKMLPYERLRAAMQAAGCQLTGADLGLDPEFSRDAVRLARFTRDRFTMLDLAGDSARLDAFAATCT